MATTYMYVHFIYFWKGTLTSFSIWPALAPSWLNATDMANSSVGSRWLQLQPEAFALAFAAMCGSGELESLTTSGDSAAAAVTV